MNKLKILVCTHKQSEYTRTEEPFFPIQAGKALHPDLDLGFTCDNTGDNISEKNDHYSELTVLYWGWKNIKDVEYIGLNHYRRYFDADLCSSLRKRFTISFVNLCSPSSLLLRSG